MPTSPDPLDPGRLRVVGAPILILGEFGIAVALALLAPCLRHSTWLAAVLAGLAGGAAIFIRCAAAYALTDGLVRTK